MAYDIWSDEKLRVISDEWDDAYDQALENKKIESSSVVDIVSDKLNVLTNKKPFMFELDSKKYECNSYVDLVLKTIGLLNELNEEKLVALAKGNFEGRLVFVDENSKEAVILSMMSGKQTANNNVIVEMHGSGKDLGVFLKSLLVEFGVLTLKTYLK